MAKDTRDLVSAHEPPSRWQRAWETTETVVVGLIFPLIAIPLILWMVLTLLGLA